MFVILSVLNVYIDVFLMEIFMSKIRIGLCKKFMSKMLGNWVSLAHCNVIFLSSIKG